LIYAPGGQVAAGVNESFHCQPDVLPTMASLAGLDYFNNTLGRDMLAPDAGKDDAVFISVSDDTRYLLKDGYAYAIKPAGDALYRLDESTADGKAHDLSKEEPERAQAMRRQAMDFYYTSQWLLHNNGKARVREARKALEAREKGGN